MDTKEIYIHFSEYNKLIRELNNKIYYVCPTTTFEKPSELTVICLLFTRKKHTEVLTLSVDTSVLTLCHFVGILRRKLGQ